MREIILFVGFGIFFIYLVVFWLGRFLRDTGGIVRERGRLFREGKRFQGERALQKELVRVFFAALAVRLLVYLAGAAWALLNSQEGGAGFQDILAQWERWDAPHYIQLAKQGYQGYVEEGQHLFLVFFPLYPWLMRGLHFLVRNWQMCGMVLSTLAFCIGSCYFYAFVKEEFGKDIADRSYVLFVAYPFSFFFGGIMTESLFFCLLSAGFYYIARHRFLTAGIIGLFLSLCRVQGVLLLGVGLVEFCVAYRLGECLRSKRFGHFCKEFLTRGIWLFLIPVGNLIYFYLNYRVEGDFFRFQYYQEHHWYHSATWLPNCLGEILGYAFGADTESALRMAIWLPELAVFILTMALLAYMIPRHPLKYSAFLLVYTAASYSVTFLISGGRYMANALPLFIALADVLGGRPWLYRGTVLLGMLLFGVYYIGFFMGFQIM